MTSGEVKSIEELGAVPEFVKDDDFPADDAVELEDFTLRTSWFALAIQLLPYAGFLLLAHLICSTVLSQSKEMHQLFWKFVEPTSLLLRVVLIGELLRRYFDRAYHFSKSRVTDNKGRFGLSLQIAHIRYKDIREVRLEQGLLGRILNFGSLKLSTASSNDYEVKIENIDNVKEIMKEVNRRRKALSNNPV